VRLTEILYRHNTGRKRHRARHRVGSSSEKNLTRVAKDSTKESRAKHFRYLDWSRAFLSKSRYMCGLQCPKRLWQAVYDPEPAQEPLPGTAKGMGRHQGAALMAWRRCRRRTRASRLRRRREMHGDADRRLDRPRDRVDSLCAPPCGRRMGSCGYPEAVSSTDGRCRRIRVIAVCSAEGLLTEPKAAAQRRRWERVFMPLSGHSSPLVSETCGGKRAAFPRRYLRQQSEVRVCWQSAAASPEAVRGVPTSSCVTGTGIRI
jgi:hypothetical protein